MPEMSLNGKKEEFSIDEHPSSKFENLGVEFNCHNGMCGTCKIKIKKGTENISERTEEENDFPLDENERLACQCHRIKGDIEIENAKW